MTYEVLRGFTANGRIYRPGERVEGAELKHETQMATRRLIKLVSQAEAQTAGPSAPLVPSSSERSRGRG